MVDLESTLYSYLLLPPDANPFIQMQLYIVCRFGLCHMGLFHLTGYP